MNMGKIKMLKEIRSKIKLQITEIANKMKIEEDQEMRVEIKEQQEEEIIEAEWIWIENIQKKLYINYSKNRFK